MALERLAEDGNFQPMLDKVTAMKGLAAIGMFIPGRSFSFTARPGDRLQFATMFVQSNDLFFAPRDGGNRSDHHQRGAKRRAPPKPTVPWRQEARGGGERRIENGTVDRHDR